MNWLKMARDCFDSSTTYVDQNYRRNWEYAIRAFQNEHTPGSKYLTDDYKARSKIFRPKTRTIIRKNEAAANIALFSNEDVIVVTADDQSSDYAVASAEANKALLQYRLTKTIPWFKVAMGALQDAQTTGVVCSYQYWEYKQKKGRTVKDEPCIKLRPIENIRLDGAADWLNPVESSPYFIDIIPMYVCDVKAMMKSVDDKTGQPKWKQLDDEVFKMATPESVQDTETTRRLREGKGQLDPYTDQERPITDHSIVWVMKYFIRDSDDDMCFFTLGNAELLTDPKPIEEVYFHGKRPYVIGNAILETHKPFPSGVAQLSRPLQVEANEIANQRLDNVKLVLQKRWFVARGRQVDTASLLRNVPGGVTFMNDPENDVKESNWPDVTSSAYMEQDRLNVDFDELVGNFSGSSVATNRQLNETVGGMKMLNQGASVMTEYLLRTWIETWVEPVLRQVMLLEQYYETDEKVMAIASRKANLMKFGLSQITDDLMAQEVFLTVNVGQGATDPQARLQKLVGATQAAIGIIAQAPPTMNVPAIVKEIYSYAGYRDGSRFMGEGDPRLGKAMQMIQQLQGQLQGKQMDLQAQAQIEQMKLASNERIKGAEIQVNQDRIQGDLRIREAEIALQQAELELERMKIMVEVDGASQENQLKIAQLQAKVDEARVKLVAEAQSMEMDLAVKANELAQKDAELAIKQYDRKSIESNEERVHEVSSQLSTAIQSVMSEISQLKGEMEETKTNEVDKAQEQIKQLTMLAMALAKNVEAPKKKKIKGYTVNKQDGVRKGLTVIYEDGTTDHITEH
jgi:hypothetical protein